jgi:hypothetical protein
MIILVLLIVVMFLWFLSLMPVAQIAPYVWANNWLAFIAVLLVVLWLFVPALRGGPIM